MLAKHIDKIWGTFLTEGAPMRPCVRSSHRWARCPLFTEGIFEFIKNVPVAQLDRAHASKPLWAVRCGTPPRPRRPARLQKGPRRSSCRRSRRVQRRYPARAGHDFSLPPGARAQRDQPSSCSHSAARNPTSTRPSSATAMGRRTSMPSVASRASCASSSIAASRSLRPSDR